MPSPIGHRPIVIAHRGLHGPGLPHQNSLRAYDAAFAAGADMVELDVRRTRDGVLVLHHDPITASGQIIAQTDFTALDPLPDGQRIPRLIDALELVRRRRRTVMVELKEQGYELDVLRAVRERLPLEQFRFLSFEPAAMARIEAAAPEVGTGVVIPWVPDWLRDGIAHVEHALRHVAPSPLADARAGADFVLVHRLWASDAAIARAKARGLDVFVTTLDTPAQLDRWLTDPRIEGVMSNRADVAVRRRGRSTGR